MRKKERKRCEELKKESRSQRNYFETRLYTTYDRVVDDYYNTFSNPAVRNQEEWEIIDGGFPGIFGSALHRDRRWHYIHMLAERRYPLAKESLMIRMVEHGLES
ncbi:hypothetical protein Tco_0221062 [Tanacetum coccineum]